MLRATLGRAGRAGAALPRPSLVRADDTCAAHAPLVAAAVMPVRWRRPDTKDDATFEEVKATDGATIAAAKKLFERKLQDKYERDQFIRTLSAQDAISTVRRIRSSGFTDETDQRLMGFVKEFGLRSWALIAQKMGMSKEDCKRRWRCVLDPRLRRGTFSEEEDKKLRSLVDVHGTQWWLLAEKFGHTRTPKQLCERWHYTINPATRLGRWNAEELRLLVQAVATHGDNFTLVAKAVGNGRTAKSCRNKFLRFAYGRSEEGHQLPPFSLADCLRLNHLVETKGRFWELLMTEFPGRSARYLQAVYDTQMYPRVYRRRWLIYELQYLRGGMADPVLDIGGIANALTSKTRAALRARLAFEIGLDDDRQLDWRAFSSASSAARQAAFQAFHNEVWPRIGHEGWVRGEGTLRLYPKDNGSRMIVVGRDEPVEEVRNHPAIRPFVRWKHAVKALPARGAFLDRLLNYLRTGSEKQPVHRPTIQERAQAVFEREERMMTAAAYRCATPPSAEHAAVGADADVDVEIRGRDLPLPYMATVRGTAAEWAARDEDGSHDEESDAEEASAKDNPDAEVNVSEAARARTQGERLRVEEMTRRIEANPNDYRLYANRAVMMEKIGDHAAALRDYETATRLEPSHAQTRMYMAELLFVMGRNDDAEKALADVQVIVEASSEPHRKQKLLERCAILANRLRVSNRQEQKWDAFQARSPKNISQL